MEDFYFETLENTEMSFASGQMEDYHLHVLQNNELEVSAEQHEDIYVMPAEDMVVSYDANIVPEESVSDLSMMG